MQAITKQQHTTAALHTAAPKRRGRPAGIGKCRARTRLAIAEAVIAGKPVTAIARELKISRSWVHREANAPETQELMHELVRPQVERIHTLFKSALKTLDRGFSAREIVMWDGIPLDIGPDHRVRLKTVGLYVRLCKAIGALQVSDGRSSAKGILRLLRLLVSIAEFNVRLAGREARQKAAIPYVPGMTLTKHADQAGVRHPVSDS